MSIQYRCDELKRTIQTLDIAERVVLLSRSSGGRISSLIANELNLNHIVCLGYPFKHPDMADEPERYKHIADLKTPMLIIQGVNDPYGGLDVQEKYPLSKIIEIHFVDTDHDFKVDRKIAYEIFQKIENFVSLNKINSKTLF